MTTYRFEFMTLDALNRLVHGIIAIDVPASVRGGEAQWAAARAETEVLVGFGNVPAIKPLSLDAFTPHDAPTRKGL